MSDRYYGSDATHCVKDLTQTLHFHTQSVTTTTDIIESAIKVEKVITHMTRSYKSRLEDIAILSQSLLDDENISLSDSYKILVMADPEICEEVCPYCLKKNTL